MPAPQCLYADRLSSLGRLLTGFLPCCVHDAATVTGPSPQVSFAQATVYRQPTGDRSRLPVVPLREEACPWCVWSASAPTRVVKATCERWPPTMSPTDRM